MTLFDAIPVTVPCRRCGRPIDCRVRTFDVEDVSSDRPNLLIDCPDHPSTKMNLRKRTDVEKNPWVYMNPHNVEMGRGDTPQEAIDDIHRETVPGSAREKSTRSQSTLNGSTSGDPSDLKRASRHTDETTMEFSHQPAAQEQVAEGAPTVRFDSIEDLPRWFRVRSESFQWFKQILNRNLDPEGLFGHRYILIVDHTPDQDAAERDFLGYTSEEELVDWCQNDLFDGQKIVLIRDQERDVFLEPRVQVELVEHP